MGNSAGDCSPRRDVIKMLEEAQRRRELLAKYGSIARQARTAQLPHPGDSAAAGSGSGGGTPPQADPAH
jgi:hypothetical protein